MARLIDTSVFVQLERREGFLDDLDAITVGGPFALASITASELLVGVYRSTSPRRLMQRSSFVEAILSQVPVIAFDLAPARIHARLSVELAESGQSIASHGLIIAATALAYGYDVVTHNFRHFERIAGLKVYEPIW